MEDSALCLEDIIDTREEQPPVWVAYSGSKTFQVLTRPLGSKQAEFIALATETVWDRATMRKQQVLNNDTYMTLFLDWVIVDWKGLTVTDLRRLILLKDWKMARRHKGDIGCDAKAKLVLMKFSPAFAAWINRVCLDIERFNTEREEMAEKKL
jgi:hypothetical protein